MPRAKRADEARCAASPRNQGLAADLQPVSEGRPALRRLGRRYIRNRNENAADSRTACWRERRRTCGLCRDIGNEDRREIRNGVTVYRERDRLVCY